MPKSESLASPSAEPILQSVEKAIMVLEEVVSIGQLVGVTELARRVQVNPSTTYRILTTLKKAGLVQQDPVTGGYRAGTGLLRLSGPLWAAIEPRKVARPFMERLSQSTGESVNLMIPDGHWGMYIDNVEGSHNIRMVVGIGVREHLHCSAVGKAMLAYFHESVVDGMIAATGLERHTDNTITSREELLSHLERIRASGYAIDDEEGAEGTRCVGAPIFDGSGAVVAGLSVSGPAFRLSIPRLHEIAPMVVHATQEVSKQLGYQGRRE